MASFICHVFGGTKRFRLERIVRPQAPEICANRNVASTEVLCVGVGIELASASSELRR